MNMPLPKTLFLVRMNFAGVHERIYELQLDKECLDEHNEVCYWDREQDVCYSPTEQQVGTVDLTFIDKDMAQATLEGALAFREFMKEWLTNAQMAPG